MIESNFGVAFGNGLNWGINVWLSSTVVSSICSLSSGNVSALSMLQIRALDQSN